MNREGDVLTGREFVRDARASDAADLARIQVACWRHGYAGIVPAAVLAEITSAEAEARWRDRWTEAITRPPSSRHRVLVAVAAGERGDASTAAGPVDERANAADTRRPVIDAGTGGDRARSPAAGRPAWDGRSRHLPSRTVAGFASVGPTADADRWPGTDAELFELRVAPGLTGRGHGSRLLNAAADTLAEDRFGSLCAWVLEGDTALRRFLESAGWAPDGAHADLDMGVRVPVLRMHTLLVRGGDPP